MSHHRVELMKTRNNIFNLFYRFSLCICKLLNILFLRWYEFMKWRIQETYCNRVSFQCFVECFKISLLIWQDFIQCCFSLLYCICTDHLTECCNSVLIKEHMLCTAKSNSFCSKFYRFLSICRCIRICPDFHSTIFISPVHDLLELTCNCCIYSRNDAFINVSCRSI